ncbi:MAG: hypothetical protein AB6733_18055 [Clostridiaceae bacterium]
MIIKKKLKKKFMILFILLSLIITFNYLYPKNKKDIVKVSNSYLTKNFFNKGTLSLIDDTKITFNDGTMALIEVTGRSSASPNPYIKVKLKAEKDNNDNWHIISKEEEPITY